MRIVLILILLLLVKFSLQGVQITTNEQCSLCLGANKKVCKSTPTSFTQWCCDKDESNLDCGSGTFGICSDSLSSSNSKGSEYLLCPTNFKCGLQFRNALTDFEDSISPAFIPQDGSCKFEIQNYGNYSIKFSSTELKSVEVNTFLKESASEFKHRGGLKTKDGDQEIKIAHLETLIVVVVPSSNNDGGFSTSFTALNGNSKEGRKGLSVVIILLIVFGCIFLILFIIAVIYCCIKQSKESEDKGNRLGNYKPLVHDNEKGAFEEDKEEYEPGVRGEPSIAKPLEDTKPKISIKAQRKDNRLPSIRTGMNKK